MKPLHIGIAACSAEGAALCYRTICIEAPAALGSHDHPEVTVHTPVARRIHGPHLSRRLAAVGTMMLASAEKLNRSAPTS
jgi:aspartate racemase